MIIVTIIHYQIYPKNLVIDQQKCGDTLNDFSISMTTAEGVLHHKENTHPRLSKQVIRFKFKLS